MFCGKESATFYMSELSSMMPKYKFPLTSCSPGHDSFLTRTKKARKRSPLSTVLFSATGCHALSGLGPVALRHSLSTALPLSFECWKTVAFRRSTQCS